MRPTGTQRREDRIKNQAENRANRLRLEDQNLIKRYDSDIKAVKGGKQKAGVTQTSLTGLTQNWSDIPQKEGLSTLDQQIRNLIFASNNATSDQEAGAYMAAAWELQNKWQVQEDQDTTYINETRRLMGLGDNSQTAVQPRTWQNDPTQVSDQPSEGDLSMFKPQDTSVKGVEQNTLNEKGIKENNNVEISNAKKEDNTRWSGEVGSRTLTKPTMIQKDLQKAGFKDEQLIKLMEKNQEFQANRPKVTDLLKIFKK